MRLSPIVACFACVLLLASCKDSDPPSSSGDTSLACATDDDCAEGEACEAGECTAGDVGVDTADVDSDVDLDTEDADVDVEEDTDDPDAGDVTPDTDFGTECTSDDECEAGYCINTVEGRFCTQACHGDCPPNWECRSVAGEGSDVLQLCVPIVRVVCTSCDADTDCGGIQDLCLSYDDGNFCGRFCANDGDCTDGYVCEPTPDGQGGTVGQCVNQAGYCGDCLDLDNDGYGEGEGCLGLDCNDDDTSVFEGAAELCDAADNDCDETVDEGFDLTSDADHCGGCGIACDTVRGIGACAESACFVESCTDGYFDIDGDFENGCEYACVPNADTSGVEICNGLDDDCDGEVDEDFDLDGDVTNCGGCGNVCEFDAARAACSEGTCVIDSCADGFDNCDGLRENGCEIEIASDVDHCGGCDLECSLGGSTASCVFGSCSIGECEPGFRDCDGDDSNGCEINAATDAANCGVCGNECVVDAGTGACDAGFCDIAACDENFVDCDAEYANGCEIDTSNDIANCGACNTACTVDNGAPTCDAGACAIDTCDAGFYNINGLYEDGCEYACVPNEDTGGVEICNGVDDNCDGVIDEGFDTNTDLNHCGGCGIVCETPNGDAVCSDGVCAVAACDAGYVDCDGLAVTGCEVAPADDALNCGACGNVCSTTNASSSCEAGACVIDTCVAPWTDCDGDPTNGCEANLLTDEGHCGTCDVVCEAAGGTSTCAEGSCVVSECSGTLADCDAITANGCEVELMTDTSNCGGCDIKCLGANADNVCNAGECAIDACFPGYFDCDGSVANGCEIDLQADTQNCGACGNDCEVPNAVSTCDAGACMIATCAEGWADCDGDRTNGCEVFVPNDVGNCGACGTECDAANATPVCAEGSCGIASCEGTFANCDADLSTGCETDTAVDTTHCGRCNAPCDLPNAIEVCEDGGCGIGSCEPGYADCDGITENGCEASLDDSSTHCGACFDTCAVSNGAEACVVGECTVASCNAGFEDCDGDPTNGCEVNTQSDTDNCNACGVSCTDTNPDLVCQAGACVVGTCPANFADCDGDPTNGCETNTLSSGDHCGGCGTVCDVAEADEVCISGSCGIASCSAGYADCDGSYPTGCEVDLQTDTRNCGACGERCDFTSSNEACVAGTCEIASCQGTTGNCDGVVDNGCEVNLATDEDHCGGCNNFCNLPNAAEICSAGMCQVAACEPGWSNCDGDDSNGCETPTGSDITNCGGCGNVCSAINGAPSCASGVCGIASCDDPYGNCDGGVSNGCETNLDDSLANCGGCGFVCSTPNATPTCDEGSCEIVSCSGTFEDCDDTAATGCEANTANSLMHCGGCNLACAFPGAVESCSAGVCSMGACEAGFVDLDGDTSNGCEYACIVSGGVDMPDPSGTDTDCDGYDGTISNTVYLSATGSSSNSGLTPDEPVSTLSRALLVAGSAGRDVILVATGEYYSGTVSISTGGVAIYGGYAPNFQTRTGIRSIFTTTSQTLLSFAGVSTPIYFEQVELRTQSTANPGQENITVIIDASADNVTFENALIVAGRGGNGRPGNGGNNGAPGTRGSNGVGTTGGGGGSVGGGRGGNGRYENGGYPGASGNSNGSAFGGSGGIPRNGGLGCNDGNPQAGGNGGNGANGSRGANGGVGNGLGSFSGLNWVPSNGSAGSTGVTGGGGGGGAAGGGEDCDYFFGCYCDTGRGGAGGGGGGRGGTGGAGGNGGGASIAILLRNAEVNLSNVIINTMGGGHGGTGGTGGAGGGGGSGGSGADSTDDTNGAGGDGGSGGRGGDGGCGGGGGGGPSVGIWGIGSAVWDGTSVTFNIGAAGDGGGSACGSTGSNGTQTNTRGATAG